MRKLLKIASDERRRTLIKPIDLQFSVVRKEDNQLVGLIVLNISLVHQVGTVRTLTAPEYRKRGFGEEAKRVLLEYAFLYLKLVKVCSELLEIHEATLHINEKLGFRLVGILKDHVEIKDLRYSLVLMEIMREQWLRIHHLYV